MQEQKIRSRMALKEISKRKSGYGITQAQIQASPQSKIFSDPIACQGRQILQQKLFSKIG